MPIRKAADIYIVLARNGDQVEEWASTAPEQEAASLVQARLPPGWTATLSRGRPTAKQIIQARIDGVGVQKLK